MSDANETLSQTMENEALSQAIERAVDSALSSKSLQEVLDRHVNSMVEDVISDMCRWGKVKDAVKSKIEGMLIPAIESYDLAACNVKLTTLLDQLIEESAVAERRDLLEKFKLLASHDKVPEQIQFTWLADRFGDWVAEDFDCSDRNVDCGLYDNIELRVHFEPQNAYSYSRLFEYATITFEVNEDDDPNDESERFHTQVRISRYHTDDYWTIDDLRDISLHDLSQMNRFQTLIATLAQSRAKIVVDGEDTDIEFDVEPEDKPELEYV